MSFSIGGSPIGTQSIGGDDPSVYDRFKLYDLQWLGRRITGKGDTGPVNNQTLLKAGGTMLGRLRLHADPTLGNHTVTKGYIDKELQGWRIVDSGTLTDTDELQITIPPNTYPGLRLSMSSLDVEDSASREFSGLTGTEKWSGGVVGPDGKIYGIPSSATDILIIDPEAGTASRSNMGADLTGSTKWHGGILGSDGKIYGIPWNSTDILIIDPIAGTATRSAMGATLTGFSKWHGGVLGPDGKIYGIPLSSTDILIIDPVAGTASRSAMGATLTGSFKWIGGALGTDGKIYGVPLEATDILIIDPVAGTASRSNMGATLTGSDKWFGAVLGPNGKIYGIPANATDILIIDPVAGTASRSNMGATLTGSSKWYGAVLGPNGKIYGIPNSSEDILIIDPVAGTASRSNMGATLTGFNKWNGGVLSADGKIYGVPVSATDILKISIYSFQYDIKMNLDNEETQGLYSTSTIKRYTYPSSVESNNKWDKHWIIASWLGPHSNNSTVILNGTHRHSKISFQSHTSTASASNPMKNLQQSAWGNLTSNRSATVITISTQYKVLNAKWWLEGWIPGTTA